MSLECVPLGQYCEMSGETRAGINKRIQRGIWKVGEQVLKVDGVKEHWVDLDEVARWARRNKTCRAE